MHNWFQCKVTYEKMMENGMQKKVTEAYLVDALSFTEAEARITEEVSPFITGDFIVADIKRAKISEIFFNGKGDRFFKFRIAFLTINESNYKEKRTMATMITQAATLEEATEVLKEGMRNTMADYTICSQSETMLMDVFPFTPKTEKDE